MITILQKGAIYVVSLFSINRMVFFRSNRMYNVYRTVTNMYTFTNVHSTFTNTFIYIVVFIYTFINAYSTTILLRICTISLALFCQRARVPDVYIVFLSKSYCSGQGILLTKPKDTFFPLLSSPPFFAFSLTSLSSFPRPVILSKSKKKEDVSSCHLFLFLLSFPGPEHVGRIFNYIWAP